MGALELLEGFVEVLGEGMLGRVLGEVVVCVAASFERRALWLRERRGRERREERREERERDGRITSYFTQREEVVLCVYGVDQREMEESTGSVDSLSSVKSNVRSNVKSNMRSTTQSNTKSIKNEINHTIEHEINHAIKHEINHAIKHAVKHEIENRI